MATVLQRLIFPTNQNPDVIPLYVDSAIWTVVGKRPVRISDFTESEFSCERYSASIPPNSRYSFASYFNAFPASYWQRWTRLTEVELKIQTSGVGTILIYRSNSRGDAQQVATMQVEGERQTEITLPLTTFSDGGWYWFDIHTGCGDFGLLSAHWLTYEQVDESQHLTIGITTFNKPTFCIETLSSIANDDSLTDVLSTVLVIDQGTQLVESDNNFDAVASRFGEKLRIIRQPNLGGSGGFSRVMHESVQDNSTSHVLLLDDDIETETESLLRAFRFAQFTRNPTIVGGHMFDLYQRSIIHAWAEIVRPEVFMWGPSFRKQHRHDFVVSNLRQTPWMHARLDADYNGWWMCMIPVSIIKEIGYSLPFFIKWDDAEYCLRARSRGYRTVSLPGAAVWHVSWLDKDDSQDWQVYFHTRNRILAALLRSDQPIGHALLRNTSRQDIKKLLNMQYYPSHLSVEALKDILAGPSELRSTIYSAMPRARALAHDFSETTIHKDPDSIPASENGRALPVLKKSSERGPEGLQLGLFALKWISVHWLRKTSTNRPEVEYPKSEAHWWAVVKHRSYVSGTADGAGKQWYRHDRKQFRKLLLESNRLHRKLKKNWARLSNDYQRAATDLASEDSWVLVFRGDDA